MCARDTQVTLPGLLAVADATNVLRYAYRRTYVPSKTDDLSPGDVGHVLMESSVEAQTKDHSVDVGGLPNPRTFRFRDSPNAVSVGAGAGTIVPNPRGAMSRRKPLKRQFTTPAALGQSSADAEARRRRSSGAGDVPGEPWHLIRSVPEAQPSPIDGGTPRPPLERGNSTDTARASLDSASAGVAAAARDAAAQRSPRARLLTPPAVSPPESSRDATPPPALSLPLPSARKPSITAPHAANDLIEQARATAAAVMAAASGDGGSERAAAGTAPDTDSTAGEQDVEGSTSQGRPDTDPVPSVAPMPPPSDAMTSQVPAKDGAVVRAAVQVTPVDSAASSAASSPTPHGGKRVPDAITGAGLLVLQVAGAPPNSPGANFVDSGDPTQIADHSRFAALLYGPQAGGTESVSDSAGGERTDVADQGDAPSEASAKSKRGNGDA